MLVNCLQTARHKIFPVSHIRSSLAIMHVMKHSQEYSTTKHEQFAKTNEVIYRWKNHKFVILSGTCALCEPITITMVIFALYNTYNDALN